MIILYIILQRKSRKNYNKYIDLQIYLKLLFNFLIKRHTITRNEGIKITVTYVLYVLHSQRGSNPENYNHNIQVCQCKILLLTPKRIFPILNLPKSKFIIEIGRLCLTGGKETLLVIQVGYYSVLQRCATSRHLLWSRNLIPRSLCGAALIGGLSRLFRK